jgi:uncharacterized membrane protein affecting hemolysin expression
MSHYLPLEYDRSHLLLSRKQVQEGMMIDYYDIVLIAVNGLALLAILLYYLSTSHPTQPSPSVPTRKSRST